MSVFKVPNQTDIFNISNIADRYFKHIFPSRTSQMYKCPGLISIFLSLCNYEKLTIGILLVNANP